MRVIAKGYLTKEEFAKRANLSVRMIEHLVQFGKAPAGIKIPKCTVFSENEVTAFLKGRKKCQN